MEISRLAPVSFVNNHASEIPPFGVMEITGAVADGPDLVWEVTRPTSSTIASGKASQFMFNGDGYVPSGGKGGGFFPSPQVQALVLLGSSGLLSPVADQWYLGTGRHYEAVLDADPLGIHEEGSAIVWRVQTRTDGGGLRFARYSLTEAMNVSSSDTDADLYSLDGSTTISETIVRDSYSIAQWQANGDGGLAVYNGTFWVVVNPWCAES